MSDTSPGSLRVALQFHIFLLPGFYSVYKYAHDNAQALGALTHVTLEDNNNFLGFPSYICSMPCRIGTNDPHQKGNELFCRGLVSHKQELDLILLPYVSDDKGRILKYLCSLPCSRFLICGLVRQVSFHGV